MHSRYSAALRRTATGSRTRVVCRQMIWFEKYGKPKNFPQNHFRVRPRDTPTTAWSRARLGWACSSPTAVATPTPITSREGPAFSGDVVTDFKVFTVRFAALPEAGQIVTRNTRRGFEPHQPDRPRVSPFASSAMGAVRAVAGGWAVRRPPAANTHLTQALG
jgi:hypothetical protein